MSTTSLDFGLIMNEVRGLANDDDLEMASIFKKAVESSPDQDVQATAKSLVDDLLALGATKYDPNEQPTYGGGPTPLVEHTWTVLLLVASCVPPAHHAQDALAEAVLLLDGRGGPWEGRPGLALQVREYWNFSPTFDPDPDNTDDRNFTQDQWVNLNAFVARLFGATAQGLANFGLWELRGALEGDDQDDDAMKRHPGIADARARAAAEWVLRGGTRLLRLSREGFPADDGDSTTCGGGGDPYRAGPLFSGPGGFSLARWAFWKRRFGEVRGTVGAGAAAAVGEAVEAMERLEREAGVDNSVEA